jgi:ubiquinone/menaquinone biosynthesis C-methylase UbiE
MILDNIDLKEMYEQGENISSLLRKKNGSKFNNEHIIEIAYDLQAGSYIVQMEDKFTADQTAQFSVELARIIKSLGKLTSILETGVGEATTLSGVLENLKNEEIDSYGFDLSWSRIAFAKQWLKRKGIHNVTLCTGSLLNIPFADNSVDIVYTSHSIEPNGGNEKPILKELYRVAKKFVVLLEPGYEFASSESKKRMESHGYCKNILNISKELGFKIIEHKLFSDKLKPINPTALTIIEKQKKCTISSHILACPKYKTQLVEIGDGLFSPAALTVYPIVGGTPCLRIENGIIASKYPEIMRGYK